jgi:hypothetical protein
LSYNRAALIWSRSGADLVAPLRIAALIWSRPSADLVALLALIWSRPIYRTESSQKYPTERLFQKSLTEYQKEGFLILD